MIHRVLLSYLTLTVLVLLTLEIPFGILYARSRTSALTTTLERDAVVLAELAEEDIEHADTRALPHLLNGTIRRDHTQAVVVDRHGTVLTTAPTAPSPPARSLSGAPDIIAALHNHRTSGTTRDPLTGGEARYVTVPAASGPTVRGAVRITAPTRGTTARIHTAWALLAGAGLAVLAVMTAIGLTLARWTTRPVRKLERATAQLADGTLTEPPAADVGPRELRRLAATFNRTATRLQHLLRAQHRFAADASHQLKTPLTALRLRLENLEPDINADARHHLDQAIAETDRLVRMIHGLLALARLEEDHTAPTPVDADAVVHDRVETWSAFATDLDVTLRLTGAPTGHVQAIPGALEQILDNLLANALRATPPGSTVTLHRAPARAPHHRTAPPAQLHIIDQGPGMTTTERERAFDRFWRAPNTSPGGTGLGLTIARQLAQASGGSIELHAHPTGGLDAVIQLHPTSRPHGNRAG
ncbi:HAMP domain-containing sensor histidine kinase [Streptomyces sp. NPDC001793]|uniref:sensor histidine kinase n=1 Tax=Streptomyces sp. NPDC001793 TaxID=3154657 RepID=UPI003331B6E6